MLELRPLSCTNLSIFWDQMTLEANCWFRLMTVIPQLGLGNNGWNHFGHVWDALSILWDHGTLIMQMEMWNMSYSRIIAKYIECVNHYLWNQYLSPAIIMFSNCISAFWYINSLLQYFSIFWKTYRVDNSFEWYDTGGGRFEKYSCMKCCLPW